MKIKKSYPPLLYGYCKPLEKLMLLAKRFNSLLMLWVWNPQKITIYNYKITINIFQQNWRLKNNNSFKIQKTRSSINLWVRWILRWMGNMDLWVRWVRGECDLEITWPPNFVVIQFGLSRTPYFLLHSSAKDFISNRSKENIRWAHWHHHFSATLHAYYQYYQ